VKRTTAEADALVAEFESCWRAVLDGTTEAVRTLVDDLAHRHAVALADAFYLHMRALPRAEPFLAHEVVNRRLRASMRQWLAHTLGGARAPGAIGESVARQIELGVIHARVRMPIDLMARGTQFLLQAIDKHIAATAADPATRMEAYRYVGSLFSLCDELSTVSYVREIRRAARIDEAYHLLAQRREALVERERQRALLSEWTQATLFALGTSTRRGTAPSLAGSDFGRWMAHKAPLFFEDDPDVDHVHELMAHIDSALLPQLRAVPADAAIRDSLLDTLAGKLELIRFVLADLFQRVERTEQSIDTVTRLPNRRYLPAVLAREIDEHTAAGKRFCALLVRPPHPGELGVAETEASRDLFLAQFSATLLGGIRPGDHLFRYRDDQFMVVAVERTRTQADALALDLQLAVRRHELLARAGDAGFGVSIGIAEFDGHPDPDDLLRRAEAALAEAIDSGEADAVMHA